MGCKRRDIIDTTDEDVTGRLRQNSLILKDLSRDIRYGGASLKNIPALIKKIIREGIWKKHIEGIEIVEFDTFDEFVTHPLPEGLEATIDQIIQLCDSDLEAQKLIQKELKRPDGGNNNPYGRKGKPEEITVDNINSDSVTRPTGTSRAAGLRRLVKDRPDLLEEVEAGKMSIHNAMIQAGFRKKTVTITVDVEAIATKLKRTLTRQQIDSLITILQGTNS